MKIYNEVITRFNDLTGKWETISEDSYEYSGAIFKLQKGDKYETINFNLAF